MKFISGVIHPFLKHRFLAEIRENGGFYSLGMDSTEMQKKRYHAVVIRFVKNEIIKLMIKLLRYFHDKIKMRVLDVISEPSEKAVDMANLLKECLIENGLELKKMGAFTADNTNTNFGGLKRRGHNNLYSILKQGLFFIYFLFKFKAKLLFKIILH